MLLNLRSCSGLSAIQRAENVIDALSPAAWYHMRGSGVPTSSGGFASMWPDMADTDNGLVLPGVLGNKASAPHISAYEFGAGSFTCAAWVEVAALGVWSVVVGAGKSTGADFRCFISTTNSLRLGWGTDAQLYTQSTGTISANTLTHLVWGYNASSGKVFYAIDGVYEEIVQANHALSGSDSLIIGGDVTSYEFKGSIYACRVYGSALSSTQIAADYALGVSSATSGAVFDADFSAQPKGTTSFTESSSNAATVTVNKSGALPAHIGNKKDLLQGTGTNQPAYSAGVLTFDGVDNYLKTNAFTLNQPEAVYLVVNQVSWAINDTFFDGNTANTSLVYQTGSTPTVALFAGGAAASNTNLAVGTFGIMCALFNGASSVLRINNTTETTGNPGAGNMGGLTLGALAAPGLHSNIAIKEFVIFSAAHDAATRASVVAALNTLNTVF